MRVRRTLTDSGTITFDDVDLSDAHITSVAADGGNTLGGTLTAVVSDDGDRGRRRHGELDLQRGQQRHAVPGGGQTATETFTVTIDDGNGGTVDQLVTVTVTGTNDAPTISAADASGAVTEDASAPNLAPTAARSRSTTST